MPGTHHRRIGSDHLPRNQDGERLLDVIWPPPAARSFRTLPACGSPGSALTVLAVLLYLSRCELLPAPEPLCVLSGIVCICAGLMPSLDVSAHVLPPSCLITLIPSAASPLFGPSPLFFCTAVVIPSTMVCAVALLTFSRPL